MFKSKHGGRIRPIKFSIFTVIITTLPGNWAAQRLRE